MSRGIKYTPRRIKCCATCEYLIPPEEPYREVIQDTVIESGTFCQLIGAYQCHKSGRWWSTADNRPPQDRCSMHKFKDKSLVR